MKFVLSLLAVVVLIMAQDPDVTNKEVKTKEPEVTTIEPEVTTIEPEVTTKEPEVTTKEKEETTKGKEVTVGAGEVCKKDGDCGEGYCCVIHSMGFKRRRRFLFGNTHFYYHSTGRCEAEREEDESCHVFIIHDFFNHNLSQGYCPCVAGLECRGETVHESAGSIVHHNPKCQPKSSSATDQ